MPIDLTKPIRRKSDRAPVGMVSLITRYYVEPKDDPEVYVLSESEFEAIYENIPEPRKPARWVVSETSRIGMPIDNDWTPMVPCVYLIEWPKHAPIPDWPEGYA